MRLRLPVFTAACCAALWAPAAFAQSPAATAVTTLQQLEELALRRNPDLLAARQRLAEAQGLLRQAGLRPNPSLEISFANGDVVASRGERQLELGYSHPLELAGKRGRRVESARIQAELVQMEIADRERLLRGQLRTLYIESLAAAHSLRNAEELLALVQQSYELIQARVREGESPALDQSLLQVERNRIASDRILLQGQLERAILSLRSLACLEDHEALELPSTLLAGAVPGGAVMHLEQALERRPDLRAARLQERLAEAELELARAQAAPDLILTGRYAYQQTRLEGYAWATLNGPLAPIRDRDNLAAAGVSISLPIRNRNQGNIEAAIARQRAARLRREALERAVRQEVLAATSRYQTAQQALELFEKGVLDRASENLKIIRAAYEQGELRLLDVVQEQRKLIEIQAAHTALLRDAALAAAGLEIAAGGSIQ